MRFITNQVNKYSALGKEESLVKVQLENFLKKALLVAVIVSMISMITITISLLNGTEFELKSLLMYIYATFPGLIIYWIASLIVKFKLM